MRVSSDSIDSLASDILEKTGTDKISIDVLIDTFKYADRRGLNSHGVGRLPLYIHKINAGHLNHVDEIETVSEHGAISILDAHNGFGQIAGIHALEEGIKKADEYGVGIVGVRNSNNFGTAGYFGYKAAEQGYIALIFANSAPALAPTGGTKPLFGTNPICYAFPGTDKHPPIVLDMAVTAVARGKIRLAAKNNEKIPYGWAVDKEGNPTNDPIKAIEGLLLPIGDYKGYGLALLVDILAGLLTGSEYAGGVKPLGKLNEDSRNGHMFIVINKSFFLNKSEYRDKIDFLWDAVRNCGNEGSVFLPGEKGDILSGNKEGTIELSDKQIEEINAIAEEMGINDRIEPLHE